MNYETEKGQHILIGNTEVYIEINGNEESKKTILFLHGASMNLLSIKRLGIKLKNYKCVYFDFIGHGKTGGKIPNSINEYIKFTKKLINKLKAKKILTNDTVLIGYSLGGRLGMDICIHNFPFIKQAILLHVCDFSLVSVWTQTKKIIKKPHKIISTIFGKKSKPIYVVKKLLEHPRDFFSIIKDFIIIMQSNPIHLDKIKIPITFISSDYDIFCPLEKVKEWHEEIDSSKLIIMDEKGHTGILDHPEEYAIAILKEINNVK